MLDLAVTILTFYMAICNDFVEFFTNALTRGSGLTCDLIEPYYVVNVQ
jgi:hypothetical protein